MDMKGLVQSLGLVMLPQIILRMEQLAKNASPASIEVGLEGIALPGTGRQRKEGSHWFEASG